MEASHVWERILCAVVVVRGRAERVPAKGVRVRVCLVSHPAMYRQAAEEISFCQPTVPLSRPLPIPALGMLLPLSREGEGSFSRESLLD